MTVEQISEAIEGARLYGRGADNHLISGFSNIRNVMFQSINAVYNDNKEIDEALEEMDQNLRNLNE